MKRKTIVILLACLFITCLFKYRQYLLRKAPEVYHYNQESILTKYTYYNGVQYHLIDNSRLIDFEIMKNTNHSGSLKYDWEYDSICLLENDKKIAVMKELNASELSVINIPNYDGLQIKCGDNILTGWGDDALDPFLGGGYYSFNGSMIGRDDFYYFENMLIIGVNQSLNLYKLKDKRIYAYLSSEKIEESDSTGFILGISLYNDNIYFVYRKGEYDFKNLYRNYRVLLNHYHSDILYKYNSNTDEMEEVYTTDNIIIRYTDKEIYMLTRNFELLHYSFETQETISLGKISKTCDEVHNCKDLIVFYKGNHLLKIFDTKKNAFVEVPN